jgi:hypothetical protein
MEKIECSVCHGFEFELWGVFDEDDKFICDHCIP